MNLKLQFCKKRMQTDSVEQGSKKLVQFTSTKTSSSCIHVYVPFEGVSSVTGWLPTPSPFTVVALTYTLYFVPGFNSSFNMTERRTLTFSTTWI